MNRRHNAQEAVESINRARNAGFNNLNIDLIYGIPGMTAKLWQQNLETFQLLDIEHLSAYHLTFEPKTIFSLNMKKGKMKPIDEDKSIEQFEILLDFTAKYGYDHYEISNFAREGFYSKHNLGYWTGEPYLGIGPSAHSFQRNQRRYNIRNNIKYIDSLLQGKKDHFESESIDLRTAYNEYLLISFRTKWGVSKTYLLENFGNDYLESFQKSSEKFLADKTLITNGDNCILSRKGKFIADYVIAELMIVD
jgi:oxygen-independent coproporphyrinogen III oxidase